jgi:cell division protein FtsA
MDVRLGHPNVHLSGKAREEINQPMYATSVGLIMKGLEYLKENNTQLRFGDRKPEAGTNQNLERHEAGVEVSETVQEEQDNEKQSRAPGSIGDRLRNFWSKIIEATDERLDENHIN